MMVTDEELKQLLRDSKGWPRLGDAAADCIEELEAKLDDAIRSGKDWFEQQKKAHDRAVSAEAKLAKAVEALDEAVYLLEPSEKDMDRRAGVYRIVTTLREMKGE